MSIKLLFKKKKLPWHLCQKSVGRVCAYLVDPMLHTDPRPAVSLETRSFNPPALFLSFPDEALLLRTSLRVSLENVPAPEPVASTQRMREPSDFD